MDCGGIEVADRAADESVERMEFLLTMRRRGIIDQAVLRALDEVPREHFVDAHMTDAAYADQALPIACGQTISQPYVVAYMTEQLAVRPEHRVLEIGTGSGYQAAVLPRLAREVVSIERYRTLADTARARLKTLGFDNVEILLGDGLSGAPTRAPFERIMVTAAAEDIPPKLVDQLADGGIMVLPLGPHSGAQMLVKLTKTRRELKSEELIPVRFVPLLPGRAREL
jgi:protein-L-isoaspartate(D-aspartate) O-methyltransferase